VTERGGLIEGFCRNPSDPSAFGSVTETNGVRITAHAIYNHLFSRFHSLSEDMSVYGIQSRDEYFFTYQVKIEAVFDEDSEVK
jgi:hypothetical protein